MCNSIVHAPAFNGISDPFGFSTFHLLRTCNRLVLPTDVRNYYSLLKDSNNNVVSNKTFKTTPDEIQTKSLNYLPNAETSKSDLPPIANNGFPKEVHSSNVPNIQLASDTSECSPLGFDYQSDYPLTAMPNRFADFSYSNILSRRQRGEKRPIPNEQKDEKYYERRKRNNEAAKKSRDARKLREDRIAFRAALLEQENAIMRAQMIALREEINTLRQMMTSSRPAQIPVSV